MVSGLVVFGVVVVVVVVVVGLGVRVGKISPGLSAASDSGFMDFSDSAKIGCE